MEDNKQSSSDSDSDTNSSDSDSDSYLDAKSIIENDESDHNASFETGDSEDEPLDKSNRNKSKKVLSDSGEQDKSDLKKDAKLSSQTESNNAAKIFTSKIFKDKLSQFRKTDESQSNTNLATSAGFFMPRWNSESNLRERQNRNPCHEISGKYVWQTNKMSCQKEESSTIVIIPEEKEINAGSEYLKKSNTIATGLSSKEISSKEKTFVWHGSASTPILTKNEITSKEKNSLRGKQLFSVDTFKCLEIVKDDTTSTNMNSSLNALITSEIAKDEKTSKNINSSPNILKSLEIAKEETTSKNMNSSLNTLKTSEIGSFEDVKTGFTWNINAQSGKKHTDTYKENQMSKKPSDLYKENINRLEEKLNKLSEENAMLKDKPNRITIKEEMSSLQAKFLQPYFNTQQNECLVHYSAEEKSVILIGPENLVNEFQLKLMIELRNIKEESIKISKVMLSVLSGVKGEKFFMNLDLNGAFSVLEDGSVKVAARDKDILTDALKLLKTKLEGIETFTSAVDMPTEKFLTLKLRIEQELLVSINCEGKNIIITGVLDDVITASKSVKAFVDEIGDSEWTFTVGEPEAKFLYYFMEDKIDSILRSLETPEKSITEHQICIRIKGRKSEVNTASTSLQDLQKNIKTTVWLLKKDFKDYELFLIAKHYLSEKNNLTSYNYKEKYLFTFQISGSLDLFKASQIEKDSKNMQRNAHFIKSSPREATQDPMPSSDGMLTFTLSSTCQLTIKSEGDITRQDSNILVSLLGTDIDMTKTSVGQSFHKLCPNHWKEVKAYHNSNPHVKIIVILNPEGLNCLAVLHIILSTWNRNSSRAQLSDAIGCVLDEAKCLGAKSISFPPLGYGRMFKFPPDVVAEVLIKSFRENDVGTFLQDVIVLAPDSKFFEEMKINTSKYFTTKVNGTLGRNFGNICALPKGISQASCGKEGNKAEDDIELIEGINIQTNSHILHTSQITIYTQQNVDVEKLKMQKKKEIKDEFLQTDAIKQDILKDWPTTSWKKILKEAIEHNVWVEKSQNTSNKNIEFHLTGRKEMVVHLKTLIHLELQTLTSYLPKNRLYSSQAPKRGTIEFLRYASESDEHFPSYWSLSSNEKYWEQIKAGKIIDKSQFNILVDVDQATKKAISDIFIQTQQLNLIGHGADAKGLKYSGLKVTDVKRVENPELFESYRRERELLFKKMVKMGRTCENISNLLGSHGEVATFKCLADFLKRELYYEINEHYLFHGAKSDAVTTLINHGLDPRVSNNSCMFGKGIYTAEKSTKADQYSDVKGNRVPNGKPLKIILTRMLLGNVFLCDGNHKSVVSKDGKKLSRPPCMKCSEDVCRCPDQILYDSVMGNGHWLFREFVVYEGRYCYPEYIITYERT